MANKQPVSPNAGACQLAEHSMMQLNNPNHNTKTSPRSESKTARVAKSSAVTWISLPHKSQLIILALCRLSEPLSNTCLLPYIYYLIRSLQDPANSSLAWISRQAGLLVALFALAQFFTSVPWSYFADRWGRKPVIIVGLVLSIISNVGFGFSRNISAVMCWRVLAGIGNGNIGVMRTMTAEIVKEKKYQSRAFLMLPLVFNSGNVAGLAIGGLLADPVVNLPWLFGPGGILNISSDQKGVLWMRDFPFALPTIFNAAILMASLLLAVLGLRETMTGKPEGRDYGLVLGILIRRLTDRLNWTRRRTEYTAVHDEDQDDDENVQVEASYSCNSVIIAKKTSYKTSICSSNTWTREVLNTLISFAILPLHNAAFMQVFPVFLSTPPFNTKGSPHVKFAGGLGLPSSTIGIYLSVFGVFGILIQLFIYPSLQGRIGTLWSYRLALFMFPFPYILTPYITGIPMYSSVLRNIAIAFILFLQVTARTFAIPSSVILLTNSAPKPSALGTIHGIGNMLNSLSRAIGPVLGGFLFGLDMDIGVGGLVWWGYFPVCAVGGLAWSWTLKEASASKDEEKELELNEFTLGDQGWAKHV